MSSPLSRRLLWLSITSLVMQLFLPLTWVACYTVAISQLSARDPKLAETYVTLQKQTLSSLTPTPADMDRFIESMIPILNQISWGAVTFMAGVFAFAILGYFYARLSADRDLAGALPVLAVLSSQNPVTLAMTLADRGVTNAQQGVAIQVVLLATQLVAVYAGAQWGLLTRLRQRPPQKTGA